MPKPLTPKQQAEADLVNKLIKDHGWSFYDETPSKRFRTGMNMKTGTCFPLRCMTISVPTTSSVAVEMDKVQAARAKEEKAAKARRAPSKRA